MVLGMGPSFLLNKIRGGFYDNIEADGSNWYFIDVSPTLNEGVAQTIKDGKL